MCDFTHNIQCEEVYFEEEEEFMRSAQETVKDRMRRFAREAQACVRDSRAKVKVS